MVSTGSNRDANYPYTYQYWKSFLRASIVWQQKQLGGKKENLGVLIYTLGARGGETVFVVSPLFFACCLTVSSGGLMKS